MGYGRSVEEAGRKGSVCSVFCRQVVMERCVNGDDDEEAVNMKVMVCVCLCVFFCCLVFIFLMKSLTNILEIQLFCVFVFYISHFPSK